MLIMLQAVETAATTVTMKTDIFSLMVKGGWIMIPLVFLGAMAIYVMSDSWFALKRLLVTDTNWFSRVRSLTAKGEYGEALSISSSSTSALGSITKAALKNAALPKEQVEEEVQLEARQILARIEAPVGYLSMIAAIAPMLGFLGTIFGVIRIFINVAATNDLSISTISDGLYQKMICSGVGLLVGIIAYCGYYILNRRIDKMVTLMDKGGNLLLKAIFFKIEK